MTKASHGTCLGLSPLEHAASKNLAFTQGLENISNIKLSHHILFLPELRASFHGSRIPLKTRRMLSFEMKKICWGAQSFL